VISAIPLGTSHDQIKGSAASMAGGRRELIRSAFDPGRKKQLQKPIALRRNSGRSPPRIKHTFSNSTADVISTRVDIKSSVCGIVHCKS
jgi:hypothetical protein